MAGKVGLRHAGRVLLLRSTDEYAPCSARPGEAAEAAEEALEVWQGLIDGRWSLVDTIDTDGRHLLLAHRNPEDIRDPRGLSRMESRVVGLAVHGHSNKHIGHHLGIAEGTVSSHLARALGKLQIASRIELVRRFGTRYPRAELQQGAAVR